MENKPDLTLNTMFDALQLVGGMWPANKQAVTRQSFSISSGCQKIDFNFHKKIRDLGFDDVVISGYGQSGLSFEFIWKKEKETK